MKKILFLASLVLLCRGSVMAEVRATPQSPRGQEITADYAGVDYSTMDATIFVVSTVPTTGVVTNTSYADRQISVYGVYFTSGVCGDGVDVFTSSSGFDNRSLLMEIYNVNGTTTGVAGLGTLTCSGFSGPPRPIRVIGQNVFVRNRVAGYHRNLFLYWKEAD